MVDLHETGLYLMCMGTLIIAIGAFMLPCAIVYLICLYRKSQQEQLEKEYNKRYLPANVWIRDVDDY